MPDDKDATMGQPGAEGAGSASSAQNLLLLGELRGKQEAMAGELRDVKEEVGKVWSKLDENTAILRDIQAAVKGLPERVSGIESRCMVNHAVRQTKSADATGAHKRPLDRTVGDLLGEYLLTVLKIVGVGTVLALVLYAMQAFLATKAPAPLPTPTAPPKEAPP